VFGQSIDDSMMRIGAAPLNPNRSTVRISSWMGGDRDGNPNVTAQVTREVVALQHFRIMTLYANALDALSWQLSMQRASRALHELVQDIGRTRSRLSASVAGSVPLGGSGGASMDAVTVSPSVGSTRGGGVNHASRVMSRDYLRDSQAVGEPYRLVCAWLREQCYVTRRYWYAAALTRLGPMMAHCVSCTLRSACTWHSHGQWVLLLLL
jgi:phosphoenolpyruvate carboxylase